jgi:hypothetical protein
MKKLREMFVKTALRIDYMIVIQEYKNQMKEQH